MRLEFKGRIDPQTGVFVIDNLVDGTYDLVLTTKEGVIEGVDLRPPPGTECDKPLTEEDKQKIAKWIADNFALGKEFENKGRAIYIEGNGKCCKALVEKIRDRPFHASKGDGIWRVEIWIFDNLYGVWRKRQRSALVIQRKRMPLAELRKLVHVFDPKLGGIDIVGGKSVKDFTYQLPDKFTRDMGKVAE